MKLQVGLDADGPPPVFMDMTKGKEHESSWVRTLKLPKGSLVCIERGFSVYHWSSDLPTNAVFFVSRLKSNAMSNTRSKAPSERALTLPSIRQPDWEALIRHCAWSLTPARHRYRVQFRHQRPPPEDQGDH